MNIYRLFSRFSVLVCALGFTSLVACMGTSSSTNAATPSESSASKILLQANAVPITANQPAAITDEQLQAFGNAVGNARIASLAEQTHGTQQEFELKTRLVKYLHEQKGFDAIIIESGFFDMGMLAKSMQGGAKLDELAPGNVFYMYSRSREGRQLLQYIDETQSSAKPLAFAGMDSQHSGKLSQDQLLSGLRADLLARNSPLAHDANWADFAAVTSKLLKMQRDVPLTKQQNAFKAMAASLRQTYCVPVRHWWCQVIKSVESQAQTFWSDPADYQRDNQMGDNIIWLAEHTFAAKKVILWSHAVHAMHNYQIDAQHLYAGSIVKRHFGDDYFVLNLTAAGGRYLDDYTMEVRNLPTPDPHSLEAFLDTPDFAKPMYFVATPKPLPSDWGRLKSQVMDFNMPPNTTRNGLGSQWDAQFHIQRVNPVTLTR